MQWKRFPRRRRGTKKRGRGILYIYKNSVYLGKRPQTGSGAVSCYCSPIRKRQRPCSPLMIRLGYQQKKIKEKNKRKYKTKHGKGCGDPFKLTYSLGSQRHKSMRWGEKEIMRWWNLMFPKEWLYLTVRLLLHAIKEFQEISCHQI